jgi:hypothetical protein
MRIAVARKEDERTADSHSYCSGLALTSVMEEAWRILFDEEKVQQVAVEFRLDAPRMLSKARIRQQQQALP